MTNLVRVRYAPSPTGYPHVGNIRTALFNWLFARHHGGSFIVRIEDTDVTRKVKGAVRAILDSLRWLGLDWDEGPEVGGDCGPYFQSQRLEIYKETAERLISQGDAYHCYCSPQRLEEMRAEQVRRKQPPGYDRHCRDLTPEERAKKEAEGIVPVVRFKVPLEGRTRFNDLIYGDVVFENNTLDDFILLKSDGYPTYHLANVVDDHAMEVSHVIRAEEWISSTPRHLLLYQALGLEPPQFVHHPMILGPDRAKLSKRHGAVSILDYREQGYLPQTMFNFLALIGWSLDDKTEIMSRQALVDNFSLERISKTGAIFNREKLDWMNGVYIRSLTADEFFEAVQPYLMMDMAAGEALISDEQYVRKILPLVQERAKKLADVPALTRFFFELQLDLDLQTLIVTGMDVQSTRKALEVVRERLEKLEPFDENSLEALLRPLATELGLKTGQLFGTLRVTATGETAAPPLFQTMAVLGRKRCLKRIEAALDKIGKELA
ncbi:MAG: glutamate--tRNA ligase [Dehalococcoidales bacterium]|nr:glutamate--tRNA ligase [Dehalococcoidales bacterium]